MPRHLPEVAQQVAGPGPGLRPSTPRSQVLFGFGGFVVAVCNLGFILGDYYHISIKNGGESLIIAPCQASV